MHGRKSKLKIIYFIKKEKERKEEEEEEEESASKKWVVGHHSRAGTVVHALPIANRCGVLMQSIEIDDIKSYPSMALGLWSPQDFW